MLSEDLRHKKHQIVYHTQSNNKTTAKIEAVTFYTLKQQVLFRAPAYVEHDCV